MKRLTEEWVAKAEGDWRMASWNMDSPDPFYDGICFHAQQCVEKYFKAWMMETEGSIIKTHDLLELLDRIKTAIPEVASMRQEIGFLSVFAVAFRYPGEEALPEDARRALEITAVIRRIMREKLGLAE